MLVNSLRKILPLGVACAGGKIVDAVGDLYPVEKIAIATAVPARQREYRAGRCYARLAMQKLVEPATAILRAESREPVWPKSVVGSISHSAAYCLVIVARSAEFFALGLDVEDDAPLADELVSIVCTQNELLVGFSFAKLYFVIKEAVFKAYYPASKTFLDFHDVEVTVNHDLNLFSARLKDELPKFFGKCFVDGKFGNADGLYFAVVILPVC